VYSIKTEQFDGPFDLLLKLIEENELDISTISLARITDDYLKYLETDIIPPSELGDFLVIAAKLVLIKSRSLLPFLQPELEADGIDLEVQLRIYKEYLIASQQINTLFNLHKISYTRDKLPKTYAFTPPVGLTSSHLQVIMASILKEISVWRLPEQTMRHNELSVKDRILEIRNFLNNVISTSFSSLHKNALSKIEVIVNFLSILELLKQKLIVVEQVDVFHDFTIRKSQLIIK